MIDFLFVNVRENRILYFGKKFSSIGHFELLVRVVLLKPGRLKPQV